MTSGHSHPVEVEAKYWGRFMHPCSIGVFSVRFKMKTLIHFQGGGQKRFCCHEVISLSISVVDSKCFFPSCSVFNSTASRADFSFIISRNYTLLHYLRKQLRPFSLQMYMRVRSWENCGWSQHWALYQEVQLEKPNWMWSDNKKIIKNSRVTTSLSSLWVWAQIVWLV